MQQNSLETSQVALGGTNAVVVATINSISLKNDLHDISHRIWGRALVCVKKAVNAKHCVK